MVFNSILFFLDSVFLEGNGIFGFLGGSGGQAALGSDDPIVKGVVLTVFGVTGFGILLNLFNAERPNVYGKICFLKEIAVFNPGSLTSILDISHFLNNNRFFVSANFISLVSLSFQSLVH